MYYNDYDRSWGRALKKTLYIDNVWALSKHASWLLAFFCGFMHLGAEKAFAQVTVGSTTSSTIAGSATLTFSHTPGAGANKLLLVAIGVGGTDNPGNTPPPTVTSVTFDGITMTEVRQGGWTAGGGALGSETRALIYSLVAPNAGPADVVITISSAADTRINASATTFTGVNQTTPLGTPERVQSGSNVGSISLTLSSTTTGDLIYSTATVDEGTSNQSISADVSQTSLWDVDGLDFMSSASSYEAGTGSAVTSIYNFGDNQDNSGIIVPIKRIECTLPNCGTVTLVKNP